MAYSPVLEQAYLAKEFRREPPSPLRIVGTLLDSAFAEPTPTDVDLEQLLARLDAPPAAH